MDLELPEEGGNVLFVGEGDFSFAVSYLQKSGKIKNQQIFATCLSVDQMNMKQKLNIKLLKQNGAFVYTDVDATNLESHSVLKHFLFSRIIFNFPHAPKKMNIRDNCNLVELFLKSSKRILKEQGRIVVTLCGGQGGTHAEIVKRDWCNTWKVVILAANAGFILCDIKSFKANDFYKYESTGYRGLSKPFNTEGAITHVFCHGQMISYENFKIESNVNTVYKFLEDLKDLYEY